jgi:hypothetical protein
MYLSESNRALKCSSSLALIVMHIDAVRSMQEQFKKPNGPSEIIIESGNCWIVGKRMRPTDRQYFVLIDDGVRDIDYIFRQVETIEQIVLSSICII